jgi:serine/threonine protein kinase
VTQELGKIRPQTRGQAGKAPGFGAALGRAIRAPVVRVTLSVLLTTGLAFVQQLHLHWLVGLVVCAAALAGAAWLGATSRVRREDEPLHTFGQYTLVREIGAGGMGIVYEARHALLRRPTAIKLIRPFDVRDGVPGAGAPPGLSDVRGGVPGAGPPPCLSDVRGGVPGAGPPPRHQVEADAAARAEAVLRFEREVLLTSQLTHPNTIVIYDYGCTEDGTFYYAMEYVDGVDLDRLVRVDGPLCPARVIHLALQVCGSLAEAHRESLIHRDIKPANLLVCERGGVPDTIKVLDFGLVKRLGGPVVSGFNVLVGTPLYLAPELILDPSRASARSDIYSLGAVMYWLATGSTLQEAAFVRASSVPSALPELPIDLERVIARCTEQDPHDRPESMEQLAGELRQCADHARWSAEDAREYWQARGQRLSRVLSQPARSGAKTLAAS